MSLSSDQSAGLYCVTLHASEITDYFEILRDALAFIELWTSLMSSWGKTKMPSLRYRTIPERNVWVQFHVVLLCVTFITQNTVSCCSTRFNSPRQALDKHHCQFGQLPSFSHNSI